MAHGKYKYVTTTEVEGKTMACRIARADDLKVFRVFDAALMSAEIQDRLTAHGLLQKLTDQTNKETGDRFVAMDEVYKRLKSGEWAAERIGGMPTVSAFVEAIANLCSGTIAEAQKTVGALSDADKDKLRASAKVQAEVKKIEADRAKSTGLDLSGLLA